MTQLESKRETVLKAVRVYLQTKEGFVKERVSQTGTIYFFTDKDGAFCGKLIRVSDHPTNDGTVLTSLRYDLIGKNTSRADVKKKVFNTLNNCAAAQARKRMSWLYHMI